MSFCGSLIVDAILTKYLTEEIFESFVEATAFRFLGFGLTWFIGLVGLISLVGQGDITHILKEVDMITILYLFLFLILFSILKLA